MASHSGLLLESCSLTPAVSTSSFISTPYTADFDGTASHIGLPLECCALPAQVPGLGCVRHTPGFQMYVMRTCASLPPKG
jgi:hypothetical protein